MNKTKEIFLGHSQYEVVLNIVSKFRKNLKLLDVGAGNSPP